MGEREKERVKTKMALSILLLVIGLLTLVLMERNIFGIILNHMISRHGSSQNQHLS